MKARLFFAITILLSVTEPRTAHAEPEGQSETDHSEEARERFRRGVTLFREGAFRAALIEFQRAYELKPSFALFSNIAQTYLELGDYLAARDALLRYLDLGGSEVPADRREKVEKQLVALQDRIAALEITVNLDGAEVFVDEEPVGKTPLEDVLSVNVGRHVVRVRASDGAEQTQVVDVAGQDVRKVDFRLQRGGGQPSVVAPTVAPTPLVEPASNASENRYRKVVLVSFLSGGVLAAGTVAGIVLQRNEMQAYEKAIDTQDVDPNEVAARRANAWWRAVAVDALAGLTLAATGTGLTFWLLGRPGKEKERSANLRLGISGRQLRLIGAF